MGCPGPTSSNAATAPSTSAAPIDLERRVSEHNLGFGAKYTRPRRRRPVRLVWSSEFNRMDEAFWYEKQIQGWGREKRMALIDGRLDLLAGAGHEPTARSDDVDRRMRDFEGPLAERGGCGGLDRLDRRLG